MISGPSCCNSDSVTGYGEPNNIMFIGIAPGADEYKRTKRPLTGPSGKLLDAVLDAVGIQRASVYCTNLICHWKDAPTKDEIAVCAPRLAKELFMVKPKVVVLLGKLACETILQLPFAKARGAVIVRNGITYMATYHPAASLHKGVTAIEKELQIEAAYSLCRDLSKLPTLPREPQSEPTYNLLTTREQAQTYLNQLPTAGYPVAIDIETSYEKEHEDNHPFDHDITCIGIGYSPTHATVLTRQALDNLTWPQDIKWVFHNGMFDTQEIHRILGVTLPISEDTMLQSYSVDERNTRGLHKLKSLSREFCGADFYEEEIHKFSDTDPASLDRLYLYNAKDVVYTWRLHQVLKKQQESEQVRDLYTSILLPAAEMLARSQSRGIYINQHNMLQISQQFGTELESVEQELTQLSAKLGFPELNTNSPKQLMAMFQANGLNLMTTGKAALQDMLERLEADPISATSDDPRYNEDTIPFINKLLRYRMLYRLIRVYLLDVYKQIKYDGRVHANPFLLGTVTGRLSYKNPALNTLPKPKTVKDLGTIRSLFSATNEDYLLLEADYAQIEAWIAAWISGDPVLLADLQSGNWHTRTTEDVFLVSKQDCDPLRWATLYDGGKHLNYGCLFEEGPQGLTRRPPIGMGCDLTTARLYHKRWYERYSVFNQWRIDIKKQAQRDGYIVTPTGRKRRFPIIVSDHQLRQMVNSPIQSLANDYTLISNIRMEAALLQLDTHLLFLEHDGSYFEFPKKHQAEVLSIVKTTMETPILEGLPSIKVEMEVGPNLAELVKV